jgi:Zn-dependent protease with chaperone function
MLRAILSGLQALAYQHPFDSHALASLKDTPGIEPLVRAFNQYGVERFLKIQYTGSNLRVTRDSFPDLHALVREAGSVLDMSIEPEIYIQEGGGINALTAGVDKPIIVLNAGCIDHLGDDELFFVVGHELGHIKSGHVLYHQMGALLPFFSEIMGGLFMGLLSTALKVALLNWQRMSELTADRAGLLACQNRDAAISAMIKMAGLPHKYYARINADDFIAQAKGFKAFDENPLDRAAKVLSIMGHSHPWTVMRAAEFECWTSAGGYDRILSARTSRALQDGEAPRFCSECGRPLPVGDEIYCPECGHAIAVAAAAGC